MILSTFLKYHNPKAALLTSCSLNPDRSCRNNPDSKAVAQARLHILVSTRKSKIDVAGPKRTHPIPPGQEAQRCAELHRTERMGRGPDCQEYELKRGFFFTKHKDTSATMVFSAPDRVPSVHLLTLARAANLFVRGRLRALLVASSPPTSHLAFSFQPQMNYALLPRARASCQTPMPSA